MTLRILNFFSESKEKETIELMKQHIKRVVKTKEAFLEAYAAYGDKQEKKGELKVQEVSDQEHKADALAKEIIVNLYGGAFLPNLRSSIYKTVEEMDTVADKIQNAANMLGYLKRAKLNKELKSILEELKNCVSDCVDHLEKAVNAFLDDEAQAFKEHVDATKHVEETADNVQKAMFDELLTKNHDPLTIHIISTFGHFMATVTDAADNATDTMALLKITITS